MGAGIPHRVTSNAALRALQRIGTMAEGDEKTYDASDLARLLSAAKAEILEELGNHESDTVVALRAEVEGLQASMRGMVSTSVPAHGGGDGLSIAETWSQYEQMLSRQAAESKTARK
jgi:hypothetical protein